MGVGIFPVFYPDIQGVDFDTDGKVLAQSFETLDELAGNLGIRLFSSFSDNRPVPNGFDGDPDELLEMNGEFDEWFSSAEGAAVASRLVQAIRSNPNFAKLFPDPERLVMELETLQTCLNAAESAGAKFHLEFW